MHIFFSTDSMCLQHFTMETLNANVAARSNTTQNEGDTERDTERDANEVALCNIYPQKLATGHAMTTFITQALRRLACTIKCVYACVFTGLCEFSLSELGSN